MIPALLQRLGLQARMHPCPVLCVWGMQGQTPALAMAVEPSLMHNISDCREVHALSRQEGLLAREAFHYKEHPCNQQVCEMLRGSHCP